MPLVRHGCWLLFSDGAGDGGIGAMNEQISIKTIISSLRSCDAVSLMLFLK